MEIPELVLARRLRSGERLLWSGRPGGGVRFRAEDAFQIPFSLFAAGFLYFGFSHAPRTRVPPMFWVIVYVFVAVIGYGLVGRFVYDLFRRSRTWYGVTDQRVIIVTRLWNESESTINPRTISQIQLSERSDGSGTICFGERPPIWANRQQKAKPPMLEYIGGVRAVYNLIWSSFK